MLGAALEGSLLALCSLYPKEVAAAMAALPSDKRPKGPMDRWTLDNLIRVANHLGWLPQRKGTRGPFKIGDWVQLLRDLRNLAHPGRHLREYPRITVAAVNFRSAEEVFEAANDWLYRKVERDLLKAIEKETKRKDKKR
jgi:hypothetical protein